MPNTRTRAELPSLTKRERPTFDREIQYQYYLTLYLDSSQTKRIIRHSLHKDELADPISDKEKKQMSYRRLLKWLRASIVLLLSGGLVAVAGTTTGSLSFSNTP